jgi:hypothetical protein
MNSKFWLNFQDTLVCKALKTNFVQCITAVGNEFSQKDFFIGIKGINDQTKELINFSLESKGFGFGCHIFDTLGFFRVTEALLGLGESFYCKGQV